MINKEKITAIEGSGGTYLSNEIHYRVSFLRKNTTKRTGHIHVGFLKGKLDGYDPNNRTTMLNIIRTTIESKILPYL